MGKFITKRVCPDGFYAGTCPSSICIEVILDTVMTSVSNIRLLKRTITYNINILLYTRVFRVSIFHGPTKPNKPIN